MKNQSGFSALKVLGILEILLAISAVIIFIATNSANDLSGMAVVIPLYGMGLVSIIAVIIMISRALRAPQPQEKKSVTPTIVALLLFSIPILYFFKFSLDIFTLGYLAFLAIVIVVLIRRR